MTCSYSDSNEAAVIVLLLYHRARILKQSERHGIFLLAQNSLQSVNKKQPTAHCLLSTLPSACTNMKRCPFLTIFFFQPVLNKRMIDHSSQQSKQPDGVNFTRVPLTNASSISNLAKLTAMMSALDLVDTVCGLFCSMTANSTRSGK